MTQRCSGTTVGLWDVRIKLMFCMDECCRGLLEWNEESGIKSYVYYMKKDDTLVDSYGWRSLGSTACLKMNSSSLYIGCGCRHNLAVGKLWCFLKLLRNQFYYLLHFLDFFFSVKHHKFFYLFPLPVGSTKYLDNSSHILTLMPNFDI